jgi:hypothetical protein
LKDSKNEKEIGELFANYSVELLVESIKKVRDLDDFKGMKSTGSMSIDNMSKNNFFYVQ